LLSHPARWWRLQAQRLLLERQDLSVVPALKDLFEKHEDARVRLHALYALEGLNALNETLVKEAMDDVHPGVRCHGLILAEQYPVLRKIVLQHLEDPSIQVVLQATLSAGQFSDPGVTDPLVKAVLRNGKDPWIRLAVLSSVAGSSPEMAEGLLSNGFFQNTAEWKIAFLEDYAFSVGKENQKDRVRRFLNLMDRVSLRADAWQVAAMKGIVKGLEKADADAALKDIAKSVSVDSEEHLKNAFTALRKYYTQR
jgi:hypothetical protein